MVDQPYAHLAGIIAVNHANAVGKRNSVLDAEPAAGKYEASRPFWQFNGNAGGNHRMAPRWKQQGSVDAGAEIQPSAARCGTLGENSVFAHFFYFQGCHSKGASFLSIRFLASV